MQMRETDTEEWSFIVEEHEGCTVLFRVTDSSVDFPCHGPGSESLPPQALYDPWLHLSPCVTARDSPSSISLNMIIKQAWTKWFIRGVIVWSSFWFLCRFIKPTKRPTNRLFIKQRIFTWPRFIVNLL